MVCKDGLRRRMNIMTNDQKKKLRQENGQQTFEWKWTPNSNFNSVNV